MKKTRILIVDDSRAVCRDLSQSLNSAPGFEVVKTISNPLTAVSEIIRLKPDILVLDVVMSLLDGEDILESLGNNLDFTMGVIIISPICDDLTASRFSKLGAHYFIAKPVNCDRLIKKIRKLTETLNSDSNQGSEIRETEKYPSTQDSIAMVPKITKLLIKSGINPKLKGFCFLKESIRFICLSGNELSSVTKIVYPKIAKDYGTEAEKVERAIRTAIEKAFTVDEAGSYYYEMFGTCRERKSSKLYPSNREFIFTIAEYVKNLDLADLIV